ncbi:MAG: hypothetical protein WCE63_19245 [Acidobacteriaceae bacterium]
MHVIDQHGTIDEDAATAGDAPLTGAQSASKDNDSSEVLDRVVKELRQMADFWELLRNI